MRSATAICVIASVVVGAPAVAGNDRADTKLYRVAERSMRDMAACLAKRHHDGVIAVLETDPAAPDAADRLLRVAHGDCGNATGVTYHVHSDVLRGAVAERLYVESYAAPPAALRPRSLVPVSPAGDPVRVRYAMAACTAARDPMAADALVRAGRRTLQESDAAARLMTALKACAKGHVDFSGAELHGALSEALFKMRSADARGLN